MKENKKGTGIKPAPKTQSYLNKIENTCLLFGVIFLILFLGGYYTGNQPMEYLGLGIGVSSMIIQTKINMREE